MDSNQGEQEMRQYGYGQPGDRAFRGGLGEIYTLSKPIIYAMPVEFLKNVPCLYQMPLRLMPPAFQSRRTLYDFMSAANLSEFEPRFYAISERTLLMYPEGIKCSYVMAYFVKWFPESCEILGWTVIPRPEVGEQGWIYLDNSDMDMFFVIPAFDKKPFTYNTNIKGTTKDIIIYQAAREGIINPFKSFQPK